MIQLVYAGNPDRTKITVSGVIEGQREIRALQYSGTIRSITEQVRDQRNNVYIAWFFLAIGVTEVALAISIWRSKGFRKALGAVGMALVVLGGAIFWLIQSRVPTPPFGF